VAQSEVLLLAGGFGTRLGELTKETPKPILSVGGVPFLEHLLWNLKRHGLKRILISTGYLADKVEQALGDGTRFGLELDYLAEDQPLGTGGATKFAAPRMADEFFVLNADTLYDCNLWEVYQAAKLPWAKAGIAMRKVDDVSRYGEVVCDDQRVITFAEKSRSGAGYINAGVYYLTQELVARLPEGKCSLEADLFPALANEGVLAGVPSNGFFIDIGLPETLAEANQSAPRWRRKKCAFFDRDGILNVNTHHTHLWEDFRPVPGAFEAVRMLNSLGYLVVVVTNQAGIAKGKFTEEQYHKFMDRLALEMRAHGAHWDAAYFCPYHPTEGIGDYLRDSEDRKPKPGMLLRAMRDWEIEREGSFLIGDAITDIQAAEAAGIPGFLFTEGTVLELAQKAINA